MNKLFILGILSLFSFYICFSQKQIFTAVEKGKIDAVNQYIKEGKSLDVSFGYEICLERGEKKTYQKNLMECAINYEQWQILDLFIENKSKFNNYQEIISKAFASSISWGKMDLVKKLLAEGADMNTVCESCYNQNALQIALNYKYYEIFHFLVDNGAFINDHQNDFGYTLLMIAVIIEDKDIVEMIMNKDVAIDLPDNENYTPIMVAAENGNLEIFNILKDHNATLEGLTPDGENILALATKGNNLEIVKYLVNEAGMNVNTGDVYNNTLMVLAVKNRSLEMVQFLIEKNANLDECTNDGDYAVGLAIEQDDLEIAKTLIEAGADIWEFDYLKFARKCTKDDEFLKYLEKKIEGEED
ncbi:MAG: ankyrin repeat domain-containing protein [Bacteroidales bacterium]|nr:ankyrin repeat domain-containing protein [Bacteroidales bacterium]